MNRLLAASEPKIDLPVCVVPPSPNDGVVVVGAAPKRETLRIEDTVRPGDGAVWAGLLWPTQSY